MGFYVRSSWKIGPHTRLYYSKSLSHRRKRHRHSAPRSSARPAAAPRPDPLVRWDKDNRVLLVQRDATGRVIAQRRIGARQMTPADAHNPNVVVQQVWPYRQRATTALVLYLCGWVPGAAYNWWLRKQLKEERAATGIKPPYGGVVALQFWGLTVFVGLFVVLSVLVAALAAH